MLIFRRPAVRMLRGWAISVLQEAGAIRECEEHGWMQDRADPHAHERAFDIARQDTRRLSDQVRDVLDSIGDTCPKCPSEAGWTDSSVTPRSRRAGVRRRVSSIHASAALIHLCRSAPSASAASFIAATASRSGS
jgi:hypothetical protein